MKKYHKLFILAFYLLLFIFGVFYLYYFRPLMDDELFNYGFSKSILDGRIPYLDFNMIIPPLFPYLFSLVLKIFGNHLLVYHAFLVVLALLVTYFSFPKIGFRSICLFLFILIYPYTGYNTFCLFLFMLLIFVNDKDYKQQDIIEAVIVSGMFLTKHTLGLMVIPGIVFSKNKKKTIGIYVISLLCFLIYLISFHNLYAFLDYCVLGMIRFTSGNGSFTYLLPIEVVVILVIIIMAIRSKKREYYYLLCFQIMAFPIPNYIHFMICFVPILYYLLLHFKKSYAGTIFFTVFSIAFFLIFSFSIYFVHFDYSYLDNYPIHGFMKGRMCYRATTSYVSEISHSLERYDNYQVYILGSFSYLIKLNLDLPITKFDIINRGNMGYNGYEGYIQEMDKTCKLKNCVFYISDDEAAGRIDNQVDTKVLKYVQENYYKVYNSSIYSIYVNKKISN